MMKFGKVLGHNEVLWVLLAKKFELHLFFFFFFFFFFFVVPETSFLVDLDSGFHFFFCP